MNADEAHQQELEAREQYENDLAALRRFVEGLRGCPVMTQWQDQFESAMQQYEAITEIYIRSQNHGQD